MSEIYKNISLENIEGEIWLPMVGYEGKYEVSNLGRVKSLKANKGKVREKILYQGKVKDGYLKVNICKEGKVKNYLVHRLVCQAFIENTNNFKCVNHKDECKTNNCVNNLEWCTQKYNCNYGKAQERRVASTDYKAFQERRVANTDWEEASIKRVAHTDYKARTAKMDYKAKVANTDYKAIAEKQSKRVYQYTKDGILVGIWQSVMECGRNGYNSGAVSECCNGKRKSHRGYIWSYTEINPI